jgi:hypothetical protein
MGEKRVYYKRFDCLRRKAEQRKQEFYQLKREGRPVEELDAAYAAWHQAREEKKKAVRVQTEDQPEQ